MLYGSCDKVNHQAEAPLKKQPVIFPLEKSAFSARNTFPCVRRSGIPIP